MGKKHYHERKGWLGLFGGIGHFLGCPAHGLLGKLGGLGGSFGETKLGKIGETIHEAEIEGLAYIVSHFYSDSSASEKLRYFGPQPLHTHGDLYSEQVYHAAEAGIYALNLALIGWGAYTVGRSLYNKYWSKSSSKTDLSST